MKNQHGIPRPTRPSSGNEIGVGKWGRFDFENSEDKQPRANDLVSLSSEENRPVVTATDEIAALVAALAAQTAAIGSLVATLAPEVPDHVGTDYLAKRLSCSRAWITKLALRGDIPRDCIVPKISDGRVWRFRKDRIDAWLREREGRG